MKNSVQKIVTAILILCSTFTFAQIRKADFLIHDRGNLWETMKDDGTIGAPDPTNRFESFPSMDWPGGPHKLIKDDQRSYSPATGLWIGGKKNGNEIFFIENGPFNFVDQGTFEPIEKIDNFIGSPDYDPNLPEQTIIAQFNTTENIGVRRESYAWSFPSVNNFIIMEYTITNNSGNALSDVYIGFPSLIRPSYQDFIVHNGWGDDFNRTDEIVKYDTARGLLYAYDDTPNFSLPLDVGNFWADVFELRTPGYAGYSIIDADVPKDGGAVPSTVLFAQLLNNERFFTQSNSTKESIYNILSGADNLLQAADGDRLTPFMLLAAGPYDLASGSSVKIVLVQAVNGIPLDEVQELTTNELISAAQAKLPRGLDSLRNSIDRAAALYANNDQVQSVPPPSPIIEIIPVPQNQSITISWEPLEESWVNPITGKKNLNKYHVYRSDRSFIGPYKRVGRILPKRESDINRFFDSDINKWVFEDRTISLGAGYYYTVTAFDSTNAESWWTNRNEEAVEAARQPAENALNVKVFPNPFREVSGFPTSGAENTIVWTNLPAQCKIRIYTSSGELVKTMDHDNEFVGEESWNQLTDSRQRTAPGIYFWTVDSEVGTAKGSLLIIK